MIGISEGVVYVSDTYQPVNHLTAFISGKSRERLRRESIEQIVKQFFDKYDLNKDSIVDGKEYIKRFDRDGNGVVDRNEYRIVAGRNYDAVRF